MDEESDQQREARHRGQSLIAEPQESANLQAMMMQAIEKGPEGVEMLRELVAMQQQIEDRQAARDFAGAVAAFQADCPTIEPNRKGGHQEAYADRQQIMETIQPLLYKHGLSVTYDTADDPRGLAIWCIVRHIGGHSERTHYVSPREAASKRMNASQAEGSASEYAQRYALKLALNLRTGETDANGATPPDDTPVTAEQADWLRSMVAEVYPQPVDRAAWLAKVRIGGEPITDYDQMPARFFAQAKTTLEARKRFIEDNAEVAS